jgi:hypothetical protein
MRIERLEIMGEHKRNPTAIYFKENPWAPDFRPLLGRRRPRGKRIRRVYKILMERSDESEAQVCGQVREQAELPEPVPDDQVGEGSNQVIKVEKYKDKTILLNKVFLYFYNLLSSFRFFWLWLVNKLKRCVY